MGPNMHESHRPQALHAVCTHMLWLGVGAGNGSWIQFDGMKARHPFGTFEFPWRQAPGVGLRARMRYGRALPTHELECAGDASRGVVWTARLERE